MKEKLTIITSTWRQRWLPLALFVALAATAGPGCSGLVDSTPPATQPETNVRNYYVLLDDTHAHYTYATVYDGQSSQLQMQMKGTTPATFNSMPTYYCVWNYPNWSTNWYYGLSSDSAVDLGQSYDENWVDLKAPISEGATWKFTRPNGGLITARVTKYGAQVQMAGKTYSDVVEVTYSGTDVSSTKWFAKGIGLIYGYTQDHGDTSMYQFQAMQQ